MAKLVAIGDSLTQGFQSLAVNRTDLSYPAMIADCLGLSDDQFIVPDFSDCGGLPLNLEWFTRRIEEEFGGDLHGLLWIGAIHRGLQLLGSVRDCWEHGSGADPVDKPYHHNLGAFGFEVGDAYNLTAGLCRESFRNPKRIAAFHLPSASRLRSGYRVLNPRQDPKRDDATQVSVAKEIAEKEGGIEHLIVALGGNNYSRTIQTLRIVETGDDPSGPNSDYTLWTAAAFRREFQTLSQKISAIEAQHVYIATLPYLTISPFLRGIMRQGGELPPDRTHFDFYTYFWIREDEFDPRRHPHLTRLQVETIEARADEYNRILSDTASDRGWVVVDTWRLAHDLAVRRHHGQPRRRLPEPISDLSVLSFEIFPDGRLKQGGLYSLDGFHPTTTGYALVAQEFIEAMRPFEPGIRDIDFAAIRQSDSLVSNPPTTIDDFAALWSDLDRHFGFSTELSHRW